MSLDETLCVIYMTNTIIAVTPDLFPHFILEILGVFVRYNEFKSI